MKLEEGKGKLPDGWRWVTLEKVCRDISDGTHFTPTYVEKGIPFLSVKDVRETGISFSSCRFISEEQHQELCKRCKPERGDVLYTKVGTTGIAKAIDVDREFSIFVSVALLKLRSEVIPEYMEKVLNSPICRVQAERLTQGAANRNLVLRDLKRIEIPLPPLDEQKRIAAILNEKMEAVERSRQATLAQLEAVKALPSAYLRAVFNSPEAQKWSKKRIGDFAETCSGTTPSRERQDYYIGTISWIKTGELQDGVIEDSEEHISETALKETSLKLLPAGTLLIAMYGQGKTRGRTGLLSNPSTTNQACFAILPNLNEFDSTYLQLWFRYSYCRLRSDSEGRGGNQPNLNGDLLRAEEVPLPPLNEQQRIVVILSEQMTEVEKLCKSLEEQLNAINKLPSTFLHQAFNGEL